jgi:outer membrane protein OmpA-like peptidoglycan-associated protein
MTKGLTAILSIMMIGAALSVGTETARAGDNDVTEDQIVRALAPAEKKPLTRGLSVGPQTQTDPAATAAETRFVQTIRGRNTRSLSVTEREEIATIVKDKPKIDLEINFDYNSANISKTATAQVDALGKALSDPSLKGTTFAVAGYTDAVGSEPYNQDLSERRADAVKKYLTAKYGITTADLVTVGYGKTRLKNPNDPKAAENRRVQVVNMASKVAGN